MRRGELLKLTFGDYDRQEATLHIRETKFYKSRLLPINGEIADEIERYLRVRARRRLPTSADTPLMWNATRGGRSYTGTGLRYCVQPLLERCGITTTTGKLPRIQDLRQNAESGKMPSRGLTIYRKPLDTGGGRYPRFTRLGIISRVPEVPL
jgi:integrase